MISRNLLCTLVDRKFVRSLYIEGFTENFWHTVRDIRDLQNDFYNFDNEDIVVIFRRTQFFPRIYGIYLFSPT